MTTEDAFKKVLTLAKDCLHTQKLEADSMGPQARERHRADEEAVTIVQAFYDSERAVIRAFDG